MPSSDLILGHPLLLLGCPVLLLPPIPTNIKVFSNESTLCMRWPKYWSFSFSIIPSKEISEMNVDVHSCHLLFEYFQFALIHGPDSPCSYAILLFTALDLASITRYIHYWVLFLLWLHPFILSGVISLLISCSI